MAQEAFHLFPQLPTELRLAIWRLCLPRRVLELDHGSDESGSSDVEMWHAYFSAGTVVATLKNARPPVLSGINREARSVVFETWQQLPAPPAGADWTIHGLLQGQWIDPHNVAHTHVAYLCDDWTDSSPEIQQLQYLLWAAEWARPSQASISLDVLICLRSAYDYDSGLEDVIQLLRRRREWTLVLQGPINIHCDSLSAATVDLFGLLGDAPVQIVYLDEKARLDQFLALAGRPGFRLSYIATEEAIEVQLAVRDFMCSDIFGDSDLSDNERIEMAPDAPNFRPALMFRLCTRCECSSQISA
jgi:hypothetical protein